MQNYLNSPLILLTIISVILSSSAHASSIGEPKAWVQQFLSKMESDKNKTAEIMLMETTFAIRNRHVYEDVKDGMRLQFKYFGKYIDSNIVRIDEVGRDVIVINSVVMFEGFPSSYIFVFYRPEEKWLLVHFIMSGTIIGSNFE